MVILKAVKRRDAKGNIDGEVFADTKAETESEYEIKGLPPGCVLEPGSTIITADADFGFLKSDGDWNWITE